MRDFRDNADGSIIIIAPDTYPKTIPTMSVTLAI
jgi:hypothetical protein